MSSIAVVGVGAIGGYFASQLARAGHELVLCTRTPFERLVVETAGEPIGVEAPVLTRPREARARPVDWVLLATKAHQTAGAAPWLSALCGPATRAVVVMQNGVEQVERVAPLSGATPVLPAIVLCASEAVAPGRIVHHGYATLEVPAGSRARELARLFAGSAATVSADDDFTTALWRKLLSNAVASPITTLTGQRFGVFRRDDVRELALGLACECVKVAQAAGAALSVEEARSLPKMLAEANPEMGSSMLYDRLAGRPLEHDALTGAVVRFGARHGVPTPLHAGVLALLAAISENPGARSLS